MDLESKVNDKDSISIVNKNKETEDTKEHNDSLIKVKISQFGFCCAAVGAGLAFLSRDYEIFDKIVGYSFIAISIPIIYSEYRIGRY